MAVRLADVSADYLQRTTSLLPHGGDSTVCFWVMYPTVPAASTAYILMDAPGTYSDYVAVYAGTTNVDFEAPGHDILKPPPTNGTWFHIAWVQAGTTQRFYINAGLSGSFTYNRAAVAVADEFLGNDTFGAATEMQFAYCREWTVALTAAQLLDEMQATTAVHTANLYMDCPLTSDAVDISGNGHSWTSIGAPTFVAGPSFPTNSSVATATPLGTLPQTITQNFGSGTYGWYSYTGHTNEVLAGFWAYAAIPGDTILTTVYESDGTTVFLDMLNIENVPMQVPQTALQTIYFKVSSGSAPPTVDVTFSGLSGPTTAAAEGSIYTNDDTNGFPAGIVSGTTGINYQVQQYVNAAITASENGGDVLANGRFLLASDEDSTFRLYSPQFSQLVSVSGLVSSTSSSVRTCLTPQVFYAGHTPGTTAIARIDGDGLVTTTWTLPSAGVKGIAATNDETVIYIIGSGSIVNAAVKKFNPTTSLYGSDLVAGIATYSTLDILVMGDDSVVVIYAKAGAATQIKRYSAAGATLNTYTLGVPISDPTDSSLFHALDDPTSFWTRVHNIGTAMTCTFYNIKASDGSILATITQASYEGGIYQGAATATPLARFGLSISCPSFVLRESVIPPTPSGEAVDYIIRRERWWPHLSSEQFRQFFSMLQIDLYAGNGITAGSVDAPVQGQNPTMEIDWSDDGGHTWSDIHFVETGKIGEFKRRAILRRMGYSRDRTYRIAVSDPNQWVVINGYLQAVLGTS